MFFFLVLVAWMALKQLNRKILGIKRVDIRHQNTQRDRLTRYNNVQIRRVVYLHCVKTVKCTVESTIIRHYVTTKIR